VPSCRPAVVVFDIASGSGLETVRGLVGLAPTTRVVVLGLEDADSDIVSWAEAGASGFVGRDAPMSVLERVGSAQMNFSR
jgi:DNA-binding NarL/FixJ family response regulator